MCVCACVCVCECVCVSVCVCVRNEWEMARLREGKVVSV